MLGLMLNDQEADHLYYMIRTELEKIDEMLKVNKREDYHTSLLEDKKILTSIHNRFRKNF